MQTIPYYEVVTRIWVMAIHANNADLIGYKFLESPFWERSLSNLNELDSQLFQ
jgi:hypothetical protein